MWVQVSEGDEVLPASSVRQRKLCVCVCVQTIWFLLLTPFNPDLSTFLLLSLSLSLFFSSVAETLMDSRWATTELAWTTFPESGVS